MKDSKKYYNDVKNLFPVYGKQERQFMKEIKKSIDSLENCTYENLVEEIGEPTDIIAGYYQDIDSTYILKKIRTKNILKYCCIIITVVVLLTCLWRTYILNKAYEDFQKTLPATLEDTEVEERLGLFD
jgi:hypothetical protein